MKKDKLKGLWISDLVVPTGFSRVSHGILRFLTEQMDITGVGVNYRGDPHNFTFPIFPAFLGGDVYGVNRIVEILNRHQFDFIFILNDAWVLDHYLSNIKSRVTAKLPTIVTYFPVDAECHAEEWYKNYDVVTKAFTYTEFGKKVVNAAAPDLNIGIIPHGTNLDIFFKRFTKREDAKIHLFGDQLRELGNPKELFIVLSANRNQPRKRLDIAMEGFSLFAKNKPNFVKIYMHAGVRDSSVDIIKLSQRFGIGDRLILSGTGIGVQNLPDYRLNDIYNACEVGLNSSLGEGWSLTQTEHAVTGALQIVPNHSACAELFHDCGLLVEPVAKWTLDNSMTVGKLVDPDGVAQALEIAYSDKKLRESLSEKAMKKFTDKKYLWETIAKTWKKEIEDAVNASSTLAIKHSPNKSGDN